VLILVTVKRGLKLRHSRCCLAKDVEQGREVRSVRDTFHGSRVDPCQSAAELLKELFGRGLGVGDDRRGRLLNFSEEGNPVLNPGDLFVVLGPVYNALVQCGACGVALYLDVEGDLLRQELFDAPAGECHFNGSLTAAVYH
jgi:hypothetical protein